jgi:hypothetical protein
MFMAKRVPEEQAWILRSLKSFLEEIRCRGI